MSSTDPTARAPSEPVRASGLRWRWPVVLAAVAAGVVALGGLGVMAWPSLKLSAVACPLFSFVTVSTRNLPARGRRTQALADMRQILVVANTIYTETGRWPEGIAEMVGDQGAEGNLRSASLERFPNDPWGNEYRYEIDTSSSSVRVTCLGNDNAEGGEGEAEDLTLPEPAGR